MSSKQIMEYYYEFSRKKWFPYILANLDKPWSWFNLSKNENVDFGMILDHPELPWDSEGVSQNPNVYLETIIAHPEYPWKSWGLSKNPNITPEIVEGNPNYDWDVYGLCTNRNFDVPAIAKVIKSIKKAEKNKINPGQTYFPRKVSFLSQNSSLNWDWIMTYPKYVDLWKYEIIARNDNFKITKLLETMHIYPWSMYHMSANINLTPTMVELVPEIPWCHRGLCENPNFNLQTLIKLNYPIDVKYYCRNPNMNWKLVDKLIELGYTVSYRGLSENQMYMWRHEYVRKKLNKYYSEQIETVLENKNVPLEIGPLILSYV